MTKRTARNALIVVGAWSLSGMFVPLLSIALNPITRRLIFHDDAGIVLMWSWEGIPAVAMAVAATVVVVRLLETAHPWRWIMGLATLYVYRGVLIAVNTLRQLRVRSTADIAGITIEALMPAVACGIALMWMFRSRESRPRTL
jgi:hypothetical protein